MPSRVTRKIAVFVPRISHLRPSGSVDEIPYSIPVTVGMNMIFYARISISHQYAGELSKGNRDTDLQRLIPSQPFIKKPSQRSFGLNRAIEPAPDFVGLALISHPTRPDNSVKTSMNNRKSAGKNMSALSVQIL